MREIIVEAVVIPSRLQRLRRYVGGWIVATGFTVGAALAAVVAFTCYFRAAFGKLLDDIGAPR